MTLPLTDSFTDLSGTSQGAGGIGGLLARTDANGSAFYHADGNGNITALVNGSGAVVAKYLYDNFGNTLGMWGSLAAANPYRYSSKEQDPRSGLYYYGYRWYAPNLQRWVNRDPIGEWGGINLYRVSNNSPLDQTDPFGLLITGTSSSQLEQAGTTVEDAEAAEEVIEAGTTVTGAAGIVSAAAVVSPAVIGLLGMDPQNDPYLNPNGVNAAPNTASSLLPPKPPGPPKGPSASCPNSPNGDNEHNATGREAHKWWQPPSGFDKEFIFENGLKADAINRDTREILELKPNNPDAIAEGYNQLQKYIQQAQKQFGGQWTGRVVTY